MVLAGGQNSKGSTGKVDSSFVMKVVFFTLLVSFFVFAEPQRTFFENNTSFIEEKTIQKETSSLTQETIRSTTEQNSKQEPKEQSREETQATNDVNQKEFDIILGRTKNLPENAIVEVNSNGVELTKRQYVQCRKIRWEIENDLIDLNQISSQTKNRCIDILSFDRDAYEEEKQKQRRAEEERIAQYYEKNNYFQDISLKELTETEELSVNASEGTIKGYTIEGKEYIVEVVYCDPQINGCYLKLNGNTQFLPIITTQDEKKSITLGTKKKYTLSIKDIKFNDCGERKYCDYGHNTRDILNLEIKRGF